MHSHPHKMWLAAIVVAVLVTVADADSCEAQCRAKSNGMVGGKIVGAGPFCSADCNNDCPSNQWASNTNYQWSTTCGVADSSFSDYGTSCWSGDKICCCDYTCDYECKRQGYESGELIGWEAAPNDILPDYFICTSECDKDGSGYNGDDGIGCPSRAAGKCIDGDQAKTFAGWESCVKGDVPCCCSAFDPTRSPTRTPPTTPRPTPRPSPFPSPGDPLVAYYPFTSGAATAASGNSALAGTVSGATATTGRDGGGALRFDGANDYVAFPAAVTARPRRRSDRSRATRPLRKKIRRTLERILPEPCVCGRVSTMPPPLTARPSSRTGTWTRRRVTSRCASRRRPIRL